MSVEMGDQGSKGGVVERLVFPPLHKCLGNTVSQVFTELPQRSLWRGCKIHQMSFHTLTSSPL